MFGHRVLDANDPQGVRSSQVEFEQGLADPHVGNRDLDKTVLGIDRQKVDDVRPDHAIGQRLGNFGLGIDDAGDAEAPRISPWSRVTPLTMIRLARRSVHAA